MQKTIAYTVFVLLGIVLLFFANLFFGSISIPAGMVIDILLGKTVEREAWTHIVLESRLPQVVTALFTGGGIAVSGLLLQTSFRNPLADPGILGITSGASLGVALVILFMGGITGGIAGFDFSQSMMVVVGAFLGSLVILAVIIGFASVVRNNVMLLIIGIMVGYLTSSVITLLKFFSDSESLFSYTMWGMGNFSSISSSQLPFYCITVSVGLILSVLLMKPLNALLLGERYAANLGVNIRMVRLLLLLCAGLLTAITTAYCGPVSFIGLAVPHMVRLVLGTSNHKSLLPLTMLIGAFIALLCNLLSVLPGQGGVIPLNAITPVLGVPVILYVIINQRKIQYFN
ncbi:iron complex transport system permease protein [Dysgonomonas sp. PH5-45]|uniref:iron ABC transporter permease n=1 Tax=unclassified Dysgonomonas TaxID=2630389 RepID=UPI0024735EBA|nr:MULTISPECIES: iron ABC transporter permease [unclassified Dysgonomonas]MDH6354455.1 iron complex transport system permease protein [Dysgonomonas sp. PH5-45]MDH6387354.1 iron complex transport system permease protein [Dysgonomonas sp. PH5-37]